MVKEIRKEEADSYLKKAEEFLEEAKESFLKNRFNVAGFNAIQTVINANDALTITILGKRASMDHREALRIHTDAVRVINDSSCRRILKDSLDSRTEVGYSGRMISKASAESLLRDAVRFLGWVKRYTKEKVFHSS